MYSTTLSDPRETSGPRMDRISRRGRHGGTVNIAKLKKLVFSPPSTCPIDLFGPVANRTVLERLHARLILLVSLQAAS
jgi:hypothetical protein